MIKYLFSSIDNSIKYTDPLSCTSSSRKMETDNTVVSIDCEGDSTSSSENFASLPYSNNRDDQFNSLCMKLEKKIENLSREPDMNEEFMKMVIMFLRDLPEKGQDEARCKIFQIVTETRIKYLHNNKG